MRPNSYHWKVLESIWKLVNRLRRPEPLLRYRRKPAEPMAPPTAVAGALGEIRTNSDGAGRRHAWPANCPNGITGDHPNNWD